MRADRERLEICEIDDAPELRGVSARSLSAVGSTRGESGVALSADLLVAVRLGGKDLERGLNDTS